MNPNDLATLKLSTEGAKEVVADLAKIKNEIGDLEVANENLKTAINQKKGEITAANKVVDKYASEINKSNKAIEAATNKAELLQAKIEDLENAGKSGSSQWNLYTGQLNENLEKLEENRTKLDEYKQSHKEAEQSVDSLKKTQKELKDELGQNKTKIEENKNTYDELRSKLDITQLSYNQLRKRAAELRKELNSTSKSLAPEEWKMLKSDLDAVEKQMEKVSIRSKNVADGFTTLKGSISVFAGNLMTKAVGKLKEWVNVAREWVAEGVNMAGAAEGVEHAFERLNRPGLLENLRAETKGLLNDLNLKTFAVRADNFGIPIENLGTLLKFAQQRAQETKQSFDFLAESIINGIGRKSALILDNLGISATRMQAKAKETGDFTKAVIDIVNEELEKQGDLALTSGDEKVASEVKWQNAQLKTGQSLVFIQNHWNKLSGNIADGVSTFAENYIPKIISGLERVINFFIKTYNSVDSLRAGIQMLWGVLKTFFDGGMTGIKNLLASFDLLATTIEAALDWNLEGAKEGWRNFEATISQNNKNLVNNLKSNWNGFADGINKEIGEINLNPEPKKPILGKKRFVEVDDEETKKTDTKKKTGKGESEAQRQKKELDTRLTNLENANKAELNELVNFRNKGEISEAFYNEKVIEQNKRYFENRLDKLARFQKDYKVKDKNFQSDIQKLQADANMNLSNQDAALDKARLASLAESRDKELKMLEISKNVQIRKLQDLNLNQSQLAARIEAIELSTAQLRVGILKKYGDELEKTEITNGKLRENAATEAGDALVKAETEAARKRREIEEKTRNTNRSVRDQYGVTTVSERMEEEKAIQKAFRDENLISEDKYQKTLLAIERKYQDEKLQIKEQYNIAGLRELFDAEAEALKIKHEQEYLTEEEYQEALLQLKLEYATKYAEKVQSIIGFASNAVSALQSAETSKLDAEYDARIAAAQGNADEVERLENEKAQKKLDIEKKYADVQFAIKASDIIANTAVSIMTAYAQLGPIAGSIAAAMLGITGAAQLAAANAEREKVKNATLGSSSSSGNGNFSGAITVRGNQEGGNIDVVRAQDGKQFSAVYDPVKRGFVNRPTVIVGEGPTGQSKEWVASNALVNNPTARPIIELFDAAQRSGRVGTIDMNHLMRQRLAGFDTGGFISNRQPKTSPSRRNNPMTINPYDPAMLEMLELLRYLKKNGIEAKTYFGMTELDAKLNAYYDEEDKFTEK